MNRLEDIRIDEGEDEIYAFEHNRDTYYGRVGAFHAGIVEFNGGGWDAFLRSEDGKSLSYVESYEDEETACKALRDAFRARSRKPKPATERLRNVMKNVFDLEESVEDGQTIKDLLDRKDREIERLKKVIGSTFNIGNLRLTVYDGGKTLGRVYAHGNGFTAYAPGGFSGRFLDVFDTAEEAEACIREHAEKEARDGPNDAE